MRLTRSATDQPYLRFEWLRRGAFLGNVSIMEVHKEFFPGDRRSSTTGTRATGKRGLAVLPRPAGPLLRRDRGGVSMPAAMFRRVRRVGGALPPGYPPALAPIRNTPHIEEGVTP